MKNGAIATLGILLLLAGLWVARSLEPGRGALAGATEVEEEAAGQSPPSEVDGVEGSAGATPGIEAGGSARSELDAPSHPEVPEATADGDVGELPSAWLRVHVRAAETEIGLGAIPILALDRATDEFLGETMAGGPTATLGLIPMTDGEGRASLEVPAGVDLAIDIRGMPRFPSPRIDVGVLEVDEEREIVVDLTTEFDLHFFGRVVSAVDRSALGDAHGDVLLEVDWVKGEGRFDARRSTTPLEIGPDGLFEVLAPSWKGWALRVQAPGYAPVVARLSEGHETPGTALELGLEPEGVVLAHVSDGLGEPVVGIEVALSLPIWRMGGAVGQADGLMGEDLRFAATSNAQGEARVAGLPPGVSLSVDVLEPLGKTRRLPDPVAVESGEVREIFVSVGGGTRVEGWVRDESGEAVSGMAVWLIEDPGYPMGFFQAHQKASATTESDASGRFVFEDVAPGSWFLGPKPTRAHQQPSDAEAWAPRTIALDLVEGEVTRGVELTVHRGHYIRGRVLDPQGEPVVRAFVQGFLEGTNAMTQAYVQGDGSFELGPLIPGDYQVKALLFQGAYLGSLPVRASHTDQEVELHLRQGVALRGQVVDGATGDPTTAIVQAWKIGPSTDGAWNSMEAVDGEFEFKSVEAGEWSLIAWTQDGRVAWDAPIVAGPDHQTLTLEAAVDLRVHYKGEHGVAYVGVTRGDARLAHIALSPGEQHTLHLPEGESTLGWQLIEIVPGGDPVGVVDQRVFDLRAGRNEELVLP